MIILFKDKEFWFEEKNFKKARITCFLQWLHLSQKNECEGMKGHSWYSRTQKACYLILLSPIKQSKRKTKRSKAK